MVTDEICKLYDVPEQSKRGGIVAVFKAILKFCQVLRGGVKLRSLQQGGFAMTSYFYLRRFLLLVFAFFFTLHVVPAYAASHGEYVYFDKDGEVLEVELDSAGRSVARLWIDAILEAIPYDLSRPTVHARNMFHLSAVMWDAWAAYDQHAATYMHHEKIKLDEEEVARAREIAIGFAAYRLLSHRYGFHYSPRTPPESKRIWAIFDNLMVELELDKDDKTTKGKSPVALGNRIAKTYIEAGLKDGANEKDNYNNKAYNSVNGVLIPVLPGATNLHDPNRWQAIALNSRFKEDGELTWDKDRVFLGAEWGDVTSFSLGEEDATIHEKDGEKFKVYHDPGIPPQFKGPKNKAYHWGFEMVGIWSSHLDTADEKLWDISPAGLGNAIIPTDPDAFKRYYNFYDGGDNGVGYGENPVTGKRYKRQIVPRADYARTVAEFWADGANSETPAGHWFNILNYVSEHPDFEKRLMGRGPVVNDLEWDVKSYFALGGALHDVAISAWSIKGWYDYVRPMSAIRYLASIGQCSDPKKPSYHPYGINLHPGLVEVVTEQSTKEGQRHAHLKGSEGKIAIYAWRGPEHIGDKYLDTAKVGWILGERWWPYQRSDFITPPFAGYVSGHSTYSAAAAEILTSLTGSPYFPDGMGGFLCPKDECFVFEKGPSTDVLLQWASYVDAANESGLSRIWGGIHPPADDLPGRLIGRKVAKKAFLHARDYWKGRKPKK